MAKEQRNLFVDPPTASSSDDDGTQISESGEEEDSSSDEEPIKSPVIISSTAVTKAASENITVVSVAKQSTDSDSGSESATESEPEATEPIKNPVKNSSTAVTKAASGNPIVVSAAKQSSNSDSGSETATESEPEATEQIKSPVKISSSAVTKAASGNPTVVSAAKQSSDSDSGSETATESEPEATDPPKSGSGKTLSAGKPSKNDLTMSVASLVAKSGTKRPASEGPPSKDNKKRAKVVTWAEEESTKKQPFQRLWTEEDEVSFLQGMIEYADSGKSPFEDKNGFYELLKNSISFEVSKTQFSEKIRSLRKKFMGKNRKNSAEPKFANAHDQKTYNLCKHIWGPDGIASKSTTMSVGVSKKTQSKKKELESVKQDSVFVASPTDKKVADNDKDWFDNSLLVRSIASFGVDEHFVKQRWRLVADEEKKKIEEKLKQFQAKEFQFMMEKVAFVHDVTSMVAEASKNNP